MNKYNTSLLSFFLLIASNLYASNLSNLPLSKVNYTNHPTTLRCKLLVSGYCNNYDTPSVITFCIQSFYGDPFIYRNQTLPKNLSGEDLSGFDFTGCKFTITNLTNTYLRNTILRNTTCDYGKLFLTNLGINQCFGGQSYKTGLLEDLQNIAKAYTKIENNTNKTQLLQIASGIAHLPFYKEIEFYIKVQYWSCALLVLKKKLKESARELTCLLTTDLNNAVKYYCWTTQYPKDQVNLNVRAPHNDFPGYITDFTNGLAKYQCRSENDYGLKYYREQIIKSIKGLGKTYPQVKEKSIQEEMCQIAYNLSKSYQIQQFNFLFYYLFYQNRLTELKASIGFAAWAHIHYNAKQDNIPFIHAWIHDD